MGEEWLSTNDVARRLGCSVSWVCQLIRGGKLRARRFGHSWVIEQGDFRRYIAQGKKEVKGQKN